MHRYSTGTGIYGIAVYVENADTAPIPYVLRWLSFLG
jgi:hypothetical protein